MDSADAGDIDIKSQVLQHTLAQVATRQEGDIDPVTSAKCCVICLDTISEPCEARPCSHAHFDYLCLLSWIQEHPTCPLCKADIREVRYDFDALAPEASWKSYQVPEAKIGKVAASTPQRPQPPRRNVPYYTAPRRRQDAHLAPSVSEDEVVLFRRGIYRDQLYSLHVGSNRVSQYRDLTPLLFEQDPTLVSRARMWLRRELKVFEYLHTPPSNPQGADSTTTRRRANNAEFLLSTSSPS
ncbi:hypothetical protein PG990_005182 [Apiospora arundinis]